MYYRPGPIVHSYYYYNNVKLSRFAQQSPYNLQVPKNTTMRKIEANMLEAIRWTDKSKAGSIFKADNTEVEFQHLGIFGTFGYKRQILIKLHGNLIAKIEDVYKGVVTLYTQGWRTSTTKSRLNAILSHFLPEYGIYQQNRVWYVSKGNERYMEFYEGVTLN